jgi:hypothetical protein
MDVTNRLHGNHTFLLPPLLEADNIRIEICVEDLPVKSRNILAALLVAVLLIMSGCGTSDSLSTLTVSSAGANSGGFFNLAGEGGTLQLAVTANYTSGKTVDVTNWAAYAVTITPQSTDLNGFTLQTPPSTVTINATGLMTAVTPFDCTWTDLPIATPPTTPPNWSLTGSYQVVATYHGKTSQPIFIGVGSADGNGPGGACGPA